VVPSHHELSVISFASSFDLVDELLADRESKELIARFFDSRRSFEGAMLYTLGVNDAHSVNLDDLFATSMLGVRFPPHSVRRLLGHRPTSDELSRTLRGIPDVDIWNDAADFVQAEKFLALVRGMDSDGVGHVTAGKLLARKRGRLVPVVDEVVERITRLTWRECWDGFREYLSDASRRETLEALRPLGISREAVPTLRLVDVLVWMRRSRSKDAQRARKDSGYSILDEVAFYFCFQDPVRRGGPGHPATLLSYETEARDTVDAVTAAAVRISEATVRAILEDAFRASLPLSAQTEPTYKRIANQVFSSWRTWQVFKR
jgi:hypothetical protein